MGRPDKKENKTFGMLPKPCPRRKAVRYRKSGTPDCGAAGQPWGAGGQGGKTLTRQGAIPEAALPCRRAPEKQKAGRPPPEGERRPA